MTNWVTPWFGLSPGLALEAGMHRQDHVGQPEIGEGGDDADEAVAGGAPEPAVQRAAAGWSMARPGVGLDQVARPERHQHERHEYAAPPRRDDARHDEGERYGDEQAEQRDDRGDEQELADRPDRSSASMRRQQRTRASRRLLGA
jgi:hypothetical protein